MLEMMIVHDHAVSCSRLKPTPRILNFFIVKVFDILLLRNPSRPAPKILSNTPLFKRRHVLSQVSIHAPP
jgi:hypothetical protein